MQASYMNESTVKRCLLEESNIIDKIWKVYMYRYMKSIHFFFTEKSETIVVLKMHSPT